MTKTVKLGWNTADILSGIVKTLAKEQPHKAFIELAEALANPDTNEIVISIDDDLDEEI
jgi:hypothetical protein